MTIDDLIEKFGSVESIPDEDLLGIGLVRYQGELIRKTTLDKISKKEGDPIQSVELSLEDRLSSPAISFKIRKKISDRTEKTREILTAGLSGPLGKYVSPADKELLIKSAQNFFVDRYFFHYSVPSLAESPELLFLSEAQRMVEENAPSPEFSPLIPMAIASTIDKLRSNPSAFKKAIEDLDQEGIVDILEKAQEGFRHRYDVDTIPQEIVKDFESTYGTPNMAGGAPLLSYAFRRIVMQESNPPTFWGKSLFERHKNLKEKFKAVKGAGELVDRIFCDEIDYERSNLFSHGEIYGIKAITDGLPSRIENFEDSLNSGDPIAVAYLNSFWEYESCLRTEHLVKLLTEINKSEAEQRATRREKDRFSFLEEIASTKSKAFKAKRLAAHNSKFLDHLMATAEGRVDEYLDSLPENQQVTAKLQELGVDPKKFYSGLKPKEFVVKDGEPIDLEKVKENYRQLYQHSISALFTGSAIRSPETLEKKLADALSQGGNSIPENQKIRDYVTNLNDPTQMRKVCAVCNEYSSRRNNIIDQQTVSAATHHLREVGKFIRGDSKPEDESGESYKLQLCRKNPFEDVDIGNDGGCCIGIYHHQDEFGGFDTEDNNIERLIGQFNEECGGTPSKVEGNGQYMPYYLRDRATQFVEILRGDGDRLGMALMFAGKNEREESVLLVNSIEMSNKLRGRNSGTVIREAIKYIKDYASNAGFKYVVMGRHSYNPGLEHADASKELDFQEAHKINTWKEGYYSDIGSRASGFIQL